MKSTIPVNHCYLHRPIGIEIKAYALTSCIQAQSKLLHSRVQTPHSFTIQPQFLFLHSLRLSNRTHGKQKTPTHCINSTYPHQMYTLLHPRKIVGPAKRELKTNAFFSKNIQSYKHFAANYYLLSMGYFNFSKKV